MATERFVVTDVIPVSVERLFDAWLDAREHEAFTGSPATSDRQPGGAFSAWGGYITGTTIEIVPHGRIVQLWRTTDFPPEATDSRLEIVFEPIANGTQITVLHSEIPEGQGARYEQGWKDHYFEPMKRHFGASEMPSDEGVAAKPMARERSAKAAPVAKSKPAAAKKKAAAVRKAAKKKPAVKKAAKKKPAVKKAAKKKPAVKKAAKKKAATKKPAVKKARRARR